MRPGHVVGIRPGMGERELEVIRKGVKFWQFAIGKTSNESAILKMRTCVALSGVGSGYLGGRERKRLKSGG